MNCIFQDQIQKINFDLWVGSCDMFKKVGLNIALLSWIIF